jgi:hypothetical protein
MKKFSLLLLLCFFGFKGPITAQNKIKAYLDTKQFYAPEIGPYLEIYIEFAGYTAQFVPCEGGTKATVIVDCAIADSTGQIVFKDFYALDSPISIDSTQNNFLEILRAPLPKGTYTLSITSKTPTEKKARSLAPFHLKSPTPATNCAFQLSNSSTSHLKVKSNRASRNPIITSFRCSKIISTKT